MLDALSTGGAGALATLHSRSATGAVERMVSLCLGARPGWSTAFAYRLIAEAIDLIVHVRMDRVRDETGMVALDRYVDEIIAVSPGEDGRPAFTRIFRPDPRSGLGQRGMPTEHRPPNFQDYLDAGFDPAVLRAPAGGWARPRPAVAG
jgi:Flp pilus assembly CpaF family ATPase